MTRIRSIAILPCSRVLFHKNKVALTDIVAEWPSGTIVMVRDAKGAAKFVCGSGEGGYAKVDEILEFHHDQTRERLSGWTGWNVVDEIMYTFDKSGSLVFSQQNPNSGFSAQMKAPAYCYK